jgi:flavin reductase (DIM6/NTAB) family NADH-FMN oxidoreductase RutF
VTTTTIVEPRELRTCLGRFATGVTVLTYEAEDERRGVTVNAFTSISLDPALVMVSVARTARSAVFLRERSFCVNVLASGQVDLALYFAGAATGKEVHGSWEQGPGTPRLRDTHAWLQCTPWRTYDGGDHLLFLGEVREVSFDNTSEPLLFYSGNFHWKGDELDHSGYSRRLSADRWAAQEWNLAHLEDECSSGWA